MDANLFGHSLKNLLVKKIFFSLINITLCGFQPIWLKFFQFHYFYSWQNEVKVLGITQHAAAAAAKLLQSCPTLCDPRDGSPPGSPVPGILQANTGVGSHFLLQCMKVKSESEVTQSCPTPSDPMDCSLPGSSIHGIFQARVLEWGAIAFSTTACW